MTEQRVRAARAADLDLYIWTVNDPARMDSLIEWGVRGIITDRPDVLRSRPRFA
ncbi:MAG TPA: glycerophosphodiester phosphodiesterase family protein [Candidatus Polarisedimenticolia bacterium]|nr:glycerophosphodiester phosphodiesterase family protein [Candidatus Polarisedimenticolia bacterium]